MRQVVVRLSVRLETAESSREEVMSELQRGYDMLMGLMPDIAQLRGHIDGIVTQFRGVSAARMTTQAMVLRWRT